MIVETRNQEKEDRWATIKGLYAKHEYLYVAVGIMAGFLMGVTIRDFLPIIESWRDLVTGLFPEAFGIAITVLVIDALATRRAELEKKRDLIFKMGSSSRDVAVPAVEDLRRHGWLEDGSLQGVNLDDANLEAADLNFAVLQGASLQRANLQNVDLKDADLRKANLTAANLQEARLENAELLGVDLEKANLQKVNLWEAGLLEANLTNANLLETNLRGAHCNEKTILPDAKYDSETKQYTSYYSPDTDIGRFTDSTHDHFWRPDEQVWWLSEMDYDYWVSE
ncbi:pentapeptide repeat-containing protein [Chloroflexota bacterium]